MLGKLNPAPATPSARDRNPMTVWSDPSRVNRPGSVAESAFHRHPQWYAARACCVYVMELIPTLYFRDRTAHASASRLFPASRCLTASSKHARADDSIDPPRYRPASKIASFTQSTRGFLFIMGFEYPLSRHKRLPAYGVAIAHAANRSALLEQIGGSANNAPLGQGSRNKPRRDCPL